MRLAEQWHSSFYCRILPHHAGGVKLSGIKVLSRQMALHLLDWGLLFAPLVLIRHVRGLIGVKQASVREIRNAWLICLRDWAQTSIFTLLVEVAGVLDMEALLLIRYLRDVGGCAHHGRHGATLLLYQGNVLVYVHTFGLFDIQEKLLGMASDLSSRPTLDMWFDFLPVFAEQF